MNDTCPSPADLLPMPVLEHAASVLRVLAHPHRLRIVELLTGSRQSVGELAQSMNLAPNAVSQHLNNMRAHGIVSAERSGRTVYYRVDNPHAMNVLRCIRRHGAGVED